MEWIYNELTNQSRQYALLINRSRQLIDIKSCLLLRTHTIPKMLPFSRGKTRNLVGTLDKYIHTSSGRRIGRIIHLLCLDNMVYILSSRGAREMKLKSSESSEIALSKSIRG